MAQSVEFFNSKLEPLKHLDEDAQLDLVYEWVQTGHIQKSIFRGLIGRIRSQNFQPNISTGEFKPQSS